MNPKRNPIPVHIKIDMNPFFMPLFLKFVSATIHPKIIAKIGPITGDTSIDATMTTELSINKPNRAMKLAKNK